MTTSLPPIAAFDEAARLYDHQPNPMLALEERFLPSLLPDVRGLDVVDIGCGTGRWLAKLLEAGARSLTGVDPSNRMLECACKKLPEHVALREGSAESLPLATNSADLIFMSFALSYCDQPYRAVAEIARIAKPGACVFISDLHPLTETQLNWRRTFPSPSGSIHVSSLQHDFPTLRHSLQQVGFRLASFLELPFTADDWPMFAAAGKLAALEHMQDLPAIYIAQFTNAPAPATASVTLQKAHVAHGPGSRSEGTISIAEGRVTSISHLAPDHAACADHEVDLSGYLVLPGLINAHDHLEFGLFPRLGHGPYQNSKDWADDIHANARETIALHSRVPKDVRIYWGALRNLLAGVTTVCHHNPLSSVFRSPDFPVRVVQEFGWAHSLTFDPKAEEKFAVTSSNHPFVIHAGEGVDQQTAIEIAQLDRHGILSDHTVLVHGLNCSSRDIELINRHGTALVVCPSSNRFLFGQTWEGSRLHKVHRFGLGTDSPITACGDLLDELRFAAEVFRFSPAELYETCTSRSSSILGLKHGEGTIRVGASGDLLVVRDAGVAPSARLLELTLKDIELVFVGGQVHLASDDALQRLPTPLSQGLFPLQIEGTRRWVRAPVPDLFREAQAVLGDELFLGDKRVTYAG